MARDVTTAARAAALLNTHGGPAAVYYAPLGTTYPTAIDDVINIAGGATQWQATAGWIGLGLTKGGVQLTRAFNEVKREADQTMGAYDSRVTDWSAMIATELMETSPVNLQLAWVGGPITTVAKIQTTLQVASAAGATTVTVNDAGAIASGDYVSLGNGPIQEYAQVTLVAAGVVTLSAPLTYAHISGDVILKFAFTKLEFGTARSVPSRLLAVVAPLDYDDPDSGGIVNGLRMWVFRKVKLEGGSRQITLTNTADWSVPVSFYAYPDLRVTDPETDTFSMFEFGY